MDDVDFLINDCFILEMMVVKAIVIAFACSISFLSISFGIPVAFDDEPSAAKGKHLRLLKKQPKRNLAVHRQPQNIFNLSYAFQNTPSSSYFEASSNYIHLRAAVEHFVSVPKVEDYYNPVNITAAAPFLFIVQKKAGGAHLRSQLHHAQQRMSDEISCDAAGTASTETTSQGTSHGTVGACNSLPLSSVEQGHLYVTHHRWGDIEPLQLDFVNRHGGEAAAISCVTNFQEPASRVIGCIYSRYFSTRTHSKSKKQPSSCINDLTPAEFIRLATQRDDTKTSCLNEPYRVFSRIEDEAEITQLGWRTSSIEYDATAQLQTSLTEHELQVFEQTLGRVGQCVPMIIDRYVQSHLLLQKKFPHLDANGAFDIHHSDVIFTNGSEAACEDKLLNDVMQMKTIEKLVAFERLLYDAVVQRVEAAVDKLTITGLIPQPRSDLDLNGFTTHHPYALGGSTGTTLSFASTSSMNSSKLSRSDFQYIAGIAARRNYHAFANIASPLLLFPKIQQDMIQSVIEKEYNSVSIESIWRQEFNVSMKHPLFFIHQRGSAGLILRQTLHTASKQLNLSTHIGCYSMACNTFTFPHEPKAVYGMNIQWDKVINFLGHVHNFTKEQVYMNQFSCMTSLREPVSRLISCTHRLLQNKRKHYGISERACIRTIKPNLLYRMLVRETDELGRSCLNEPFRYFSGLHDEVMINSLGMDFNIKKHIVEIKVDDFSMEIFQHTLRSLSHCTPFLLEYEPSLLLLANKFPQFYAHDAFRLGRVMNQSKFTCGNVPQLTREQRHLFEQLTAFERVLYDAVLNKTKVAYEQILNNTYNMPDIKNYL